MSDLKRIERKLDILMDAFGLNDSHRISPSEADEMASKILLQFAKKKTKKSKAVESNGQIC